MAIGEWTNAITLRLPQLRTAVKVWLAMRPLLLSATPMSSPMTRKTSQASEKLGHVAAYRSVEEVFSISKFCFSSDLRAENLCDVMGAGCHTYMDGITEDEDYGIEQTKWICCCNTD